MSVGRTRIAHAYLETFHRGLVELRTDWHEEGIPPLSLSAPWRIESLVKLPPADFGKEGGYFREDGRITFVFAPTMYPNFTHTETAVLVGGEFNEWDPFADPDRWQLKEYRLDGETVLALTLPETAELSGKRTQFKFARGDGKWLAVPDSAPNRVANQQWNDNLELDPACTGHHRFVFAIDPPATLQDEIRVVWKERKRRREECLLAPGHFFYRIGSEKSLGVERLANETRFRVFAPRATRAELLCFPPGDEEANRPAIAMNRAEDGVWEATVSGDVSGWHYWYRFEGARNFTTHFDADFPVVDPYARALVSARGPGVIVQPDEPASPEERFVPPRWHDLVIAEIHLRDVLAGAPVSLSKRERSGFRGLKKWLRKKGCYLRRLGVNAVELQPVQEFDNSSDEEYHWGYMPVNYFAPESSYSMDPAAGSQIADFRETVSAFHDAGLAVILDVVYNHVGVPNHLLFIDKRYYFETDADGNLLNWSGCGNDLRCDSVMARRLVVDSLKYLVETFDVDGFRFDLAELIGIDALREIERELKRIKPGIILIAEPWSFRGHIAPQLRETGFASWNDGFRDFMKEFVRDRVSHEAVIYFLSGSPGGFASWPAQTVNYSESHDDRTWIDDITENPDHNGFYPTPNDERRTRVMGAFLLSALGIPMLAAGQDFLRSKHGVANTYQRGDLNALDYSRIGEFRETHEFFVGWIAFRNSSPGRLFRLADPPNGDYLRFFFAGHSAAFAALYNADGSQGAERLLLAINPSEHPQTVFIGDAGKSEWKPIADENGVRPGELGPPGHLREHLWLPALSSALWRLEGS